METIDYSTRNAFFMKITPKIASEMLKRNVSNRPLSTARVEKHAKQMKNKNWKDTGEPIQYSEEGNLLNGQHRLSAIVKSRKSIELLVVTGLPQDSFDSMDTGARRSGADTLSVISDLKPTIAKGCSSAIPLVIAYERGLIPKPGAVKVTNAEIKQFYILNSEIADSCTFVHSLGRKNRLVPLSMATFLHFIMVRKHFEKADSFFERLEKGIGLDEKDVILLLRNKLITDLSAIRKIPMDHKIAIVIKAWNAFLKGRTIKYGGNLAWKTGTSFPRIS